MENMNQFEKLDIWKEALDVIAKIYKITESFPTSEIYGLTDQLKRAANSIALNIAEGRGKGNDKEFGRFLGIALGSAYEVIAGLKISNKLGFTSENDLVSVYRDLNQLVAKIHALQNTIVNNGK